jgi:hypoxanthine-DNA glycosylase
MTQAPATRTVLRGLPALLDSHTRLVILGSFPGARSLELGQYYAHPQNQLWRLVFSALSPSSPIEYCTGSYEIRSKHLLSLGVGLWDVYAACERVGSLDSAISNAQLNDLASLRHRCPQLRAIAHNGGESYKHAKTVDMLMNAAGPSQGVRALSVGNAVHAVTSVQISVHKLPSSSPAHASWSFEHKLMVWRGILQTALI